MNKHHKNVLEFAKRAKQEIPNKPKIPNLQTRILRAKLIIEEALEAVEAMGIDVATELQVPEKGTVLFAVTKEKFRVIENPDFEINIEDLAKELADCQVVTTGAAIAFGFDLEPVQESVDQNNLEKFGPGHSFREDGKLIKPEGFKSPDISKVLKEIK